MAIEQVGVMFSQPNIRMSEFSIFFDKRLCRNDLCVRIFIFSRLFLTSLPCGVFVCAISEWLYPPKSAKRGRMAMCAKN